jgi:hypothetical protein
MTKSFWIFLSSLLFVFSCSKNEETVEPDLGYGYAGLEVGKYVIYDVDSITYDDFDSSIDTASYQIKETVDSKFTDLGGEDAFKIVRYRRNSENESWYIIDVWSSKLTVTNFQQNEENITYVKLIFPVNTGDNWNGNSMNNNSSQEYEYTTTNQTEVVGTLALNDVLTVLQYDSPDKLINPEFFEEKYAKNIGMVYKRSMSLVRVNLNSNTPWLGYDVTMRLSSYGG